MPEAWDEELGREVFGKVRPGVEKGLRSEAAPCLGTIWEGSSLLSTSLLGFRKEPFPVTSLVYLSLLVTPSSSPGPGPFPQRPQRRGDGAWEGAVGDGAGPSCISADHGLLQPR